MVIVPARPRRETSAKDARAKRSLRKTTLWTFVWAFASFTVWSLASPLWSTPDGQAHDLMAYHAVRDLTVEPAPASMSGTFAITEVPQGLADSAASYTCQAWQTVPADCVVDVTDDQTPVKVLNPAGRNVPTYYVATGWPSLLVPLTLAVWADRLAAAALAALFLAWAASAALTRARRSVAITGVAVAGTPMVMYLGGALNPNSLEITAGMAVAACSVVFLREGGESWLGRVMFRRTLIAVAVMVSIRMLAPVWVIAWLAAFALLATRKHWAYAFSRRGLPWVGLAVAGVVLQVWWTLSAGMLANPGQPKYDNGMLTNLYLSMRQINYFTLTQQVGMMGWLDTPLPADVYAAVPLISLAVGAVALVIVTGRQRQAVLVLLAAQYVLPIVVQAVQYNTNGLIWQGRYTLPLTVMVPIFLMMFAADRWQAPDVSRGLTERLERFYPLGIVVLALAHLHGLYGMLRRYVSGYYGSSVLSGAWQPPFGALTLLVAQTVLLAIAAGFVIYLYRTDHVRSATPVETRVPVSV